MTDAECSKRADAVVEKVERIAHREGRRLALHLEDRDNLVFWIARALHEATTRKEAQS